MARGRPGPRPPGPARPPRLPPPGRDEYIMLSFRYFTPGRRFCITDCHGEELNRIIRKLTLLCGMTWNQAHENQGLELRPVPDERLRHVTRPANLSPDIPIFKITVSGPFRVFGARSGATFFLLWFDRRHEIDP